MRLLLVAVALLGTACSAFDVLASPTPVPSPLPAVELKYRVFDEVGRPWYCDSDFYPLARADERELARQRLPEMQKDADLFAAILRHNGVSSAVPAGAAWSPRDDQQLLAVYHDWKDLQRLSLDEAGFQGLFSFSELVRPPSGAKTADRVDGRVDSSGKVTVVTRAPGGPLNCPICLASSTRIDTPSGSVLVTDLRVGDVVWTMSAAGARVAEPILETGSMVAPPGHEVLRITLTDGRAVTASPGHPAADGRPVGSLAVGDALDGSEVVAIERLPYVGRTYDLLPAGTTGTYWADGVVLGSTLRH
jgi:hypothetical protein